MAMVEVPQSAKEIHQNIQQMLTAVIELGGGNIVHDDGHISWASTPGQPIVIADPQGKKEAGTLCVYSVDCRIPNAVLLNPLSETIGRMSEDKKWFYAITNTKYSKIVARVIGLLLDTAVAANSGNMEIKDPHFIHALAGIVKYVDDKSSKEFSIINKKVNNYADVLDDAMLEEFQLITKADPRHFVTIAYNKKSKTASLVTCFQDPEEAFKKQFGTRIRKKTWILLETLFQELFAYEDLSKSPISVQATDLRCPQFKTYLEVLVRGWSHLLPYLPHLFGDGADEINQSIVFLESCIPHINRFAEKAMWIGSATIGMITLEDGTIMEKDSPLKYATSAEDRYDELDSRRAIRDQNINQSTMDMLRDRENKRVNYYDDRGSSGYDRYRDRNRDDGRDRNRGGYRDRERGGSRDRRDERSRSESGTSTMDLAFEQEERRRRRYR